MELVYHYLRSEKLAAVVLGGLSFFIMLIAYLFAGWLGVGLFCAMALSASIRAELFDDHGNVHEFDTPRTIQVALKREAAHRQLSPEARRVLEIEKAQRKALFRAVNGFFFACMVASFFVYFTR